MSKSDEVAGIASKEFYTRIYTPFIGLMSLAGVTFLARNKMAVYAVMLLCGLGILAVLGQAAVFCSAYDISKSSFGWPLLAPYCIALGIIINELLGVP